MKRAVSLVLIANCAAPSLAQTTPPRAASGTEIAYSLPSTSVKITVGLTLTRCADKFEAKADVGIVQSVGPNPHPEQNLVIDGRNLASFWKNRKLTLETYPSGSIKSLNGGVADQTGSIIGGIIKTVGAIVALDGQNPLSLAGRCNPATMAALSRSQALTARIDILRGQIATLPVSQLASAKEAVDAMAAEVARLQTQDLRVDLPRDFVLETNRTGGTINWGRSDFAKWLRSDDPTAGTNPLVRDVIVGFCIARATPGRPAPKCDSTGVKEGDTAAGQDLEPVVLACPSDAGCTTTLVLREPVRASIAVISLSDGLAGKPTGAVLKQGDLIISQWGTLSYVPLRGGFGKTVNFAMGFDENGHKVSQTWDATARGAGIVGAGSQIVDSAIGAYRAIDGQDVARQKAEIDRINTQKAYNQARFCEAVVAAGGYTCP